MTSKFECKVSKPDEWDDKPTDLDDEIAAAHPMITGNHKRYALALDMVSARHSKGSLVELVNYLLSKIPSSEDK